MSVPLREAAILLTSRRGTQEHLSKKNGPRDPCDEDRQAARHSHVRHDTFTQTADHS